MNNTLVKGLQLLEVLSARDGAAGISELAADLQGWVAAGMTVAILCSGLSRAERMQRALSEFGCEVPIRAEGDLSLSPSRPALIPLPFSRGFLMADARRAQIEDILTKEGGQPARFEAVGENTAPAQEDARRLAEQDIQALSAVFGRQNIIVTGGDKPKG